MSLNKIAGRVSVQQRTSGWARRGLLLLVLATCGPAFAEGTRTLHPNGAIGERGVMDASDGTFFANVARGRQFLYVYAQAGEYILLGSRNRSNGGDIFVYNPQSFGIPGNETIPGAAAFTCSSQAGGTISGRAAELAGPNSADGTATVTDGFAPCFYVAPSTGIYGVRFTGATSGGQTNTASIATPPILSGNLVSAWDVTVRGSADSLTDVNGRLFTYAWTVYLQANNRRLYNDLHYVSSDGYRYRQSMRGLDPNRAAFYANTMGFTDTDGGPLYRDIRGNNAAVTSGPSISAGITAQRPQYPIFFSDISPSGANAAQVDRVLTALAIPLAPSAPQLTDPTFVGNVGGNTSTVSSGGAFTFTTLNTLTYEIVISRDGVDFDPANVDNRVLTGTALSGDHTVLWDGRDNNGIAFPVGDYAFRIVGRNGEIHFPMIDLEANFRGGPTLTKLNGTPLDTTTVYFDDRGYVAANGTPIGELNGHLCGAGSLIGQPVPSFSLAGVDSADANLNGAGNYYRSWNGSADSNADCTNNATQYFATAKGLDLWALEKSAVTELPIEIVEPTDGVDVGTMVSVTPAVLPGDTAYGSFAFSNAGDQTATGVTYGVTLGNPAQPTTCPASVNVSLLPAGVTATYNAAPACMITFAGMPAMLTPGQSLNFNFDYVVLPSNPGPIPITTTIAAVNETPGAPAPNTADAETVVARPVISVVKSSAPAPGTPVDIGDVITYTLSATIANAPLTAPLALADTLGAGLVYGSVGSSHPSFACGGSLTCTLPAGTTPGTYTVVYTATVDASAIGSVANNVVPSGGGGDNPPTCGPCGVEHPLVPPPAFPFCPAAGDPAQVFNIVNGVAIYGYTPPGTTTDVLLPLVPAAISGNLNALMLDPVRDRLLMIQRSSGTESTLWAYDPANGGWYVAFGPFASPDFPRGGFNAAGTGYLLGGGTSPQLWRVVSSSTFGYTVTQIGTMSYDNAPTDAGSGDIAFDGTGRAWLAVGQDIYHLDLSGTSPFLAVRQTRPLLGGSPSTIGWAGIAFATDGTLILANNAPSPSAYYQYDPATGVIVHRVNTAANAARDLTSCAFPVQLEPELSIAKTLTAVNGIPHTPPAGVSPGDTLTYTITVANSGGAVATLFPGDVVETVPANTTHVGGDSFTCAAATAGSSCGNTSALNVAAGASTNLTFSVQVNPTVVGASITNAVGIPGEVDCSTVPNDCVETTPVNASVTLVKTLQSGGPVADPGETLTYAITLTNSTGTPATGYGVTDVLDPNVGFVAASNGGSHAGGTVTWTGLTVPGNGALVLTVQVVVADPLPAGVTQILNAAFETGTTPPGCPPASANCVITPTAPNVTLGKALAGESGSQAGVAEAGETLTYTITLTNTGGSAATAFGVSDVLDANTTFVSASNGGAHAAGVVTWSGLNVPAGGNLVLAVVATVNDPIPAGVTQIANLAYETGTTPPACPPGGPQCVVVPTEGAVTIAKALSGESGSVAGVAEAGEQLTYTITLTNTGGSAATNFGVTDQLDANTTFVSADNGGAHVGGVVTWTGIAVPAGANVVLTVVVSVADPIPVGVTQIANLAYESGTTPPACPPAGAQCVVVPVEADVSITKALVAESGTRPGQAEAGEQLTYTITLANSGGSAATAYGVSDRLDPNTSFVSASNGGVHAGGTVTWSGLGVPAGGSLVLTVVVQVADPIPAGTTEVGNVAYETGTTPPACPPAGAQCVIVPTGPDVTIAKSASAPAPTGNPDEYAITYVVTAINGGGSTGNYDLADTLDFNGAVVGAISAPVYSTTTGDIQDGALGTLVPPMGGTIVTNEAISVGGSESWTYTVTYAVIDSELAADCSAPDGGLRNRAELGGDASGAPPAETCSGAPSVDVIKTATAPAPTGSPNQFTLTYTIDIANTGSLAGVYDLTDTLDFNGANVTAISTPAYSSASDVQDGLPGAFVPPVGGTIVSGESISAGGAERWSYTVTYTVTDAGTAQDCADPSGGLRNSAGLGGSLSGESNTCTGAPAVVIGKSVSGPTATGNPDEYTLDYLVTVQNDGTLVGSYDLVDAFTFSGVTVTSVSAITHGGSDPLAGVLGTLTAAGGTIVTGETIAAATSENFAYSVTFTIDDVAGVGTCAGGGGLVNLAALGGSSAGQVGTCSDIPDLVVTKGAGTPTPTGTPNQYTLAYTVSVANAGAAAGAYDLDDVFDFAGATIDAVSAVSHVGPDPLAGTLGTLTPAGGTIVSGETIAAGSGESFVYAVTFTLTDPAAAADCSDPAGGLRNAVAFGGSAVGEAQTCTGTPNVGITKALAGETGARPGVAEEGEQLTYTITLSNTGGSDATGHGITDALDPNTVFVSADNGGMHAAGVVTWAGLTIPANGTLTLTVVVAVADPLPEGVTEVANVAYETGTTPPACPPSGPQCVVVPTEGAVVLTKTLAGESGVNPGVAEPGEQLTYTITLANTGGSDATGFGVSDQLDPNTAFVSADNGGVHLAGLVTWSALTVPANGTLTLSVVVAVADPLPAGVAQVANVAYETGTTPPACPPAGTQCVVVPTEGAVTIVKALAGENGSIPGVAEPGEQLTYTVTLGNTGGSDVTGYGVTDRLDPNTSFVSADNGGVHAAGNVNWSGLVIPANGALSLTVVVAVADPLPIGVTEVANLAYQTGTTPPACPPAGPQCVVVPVVGAITIAKSVADASGDGEAQAGELLTYTITLVNTGGSDTIGFDVTDPLDPNTLFVSADNGGTHVGGVVSWSGLVVPAGGTLNLTLVVAVVDPLPAGVTRIGNLAYESGTTSPDCNLQPVPANCAEIPVAGIPHLMIAKTADSATLEPGGLVVYTISVGNDGDAAATGVVISDPLPAGIIAFAWTCSASGGATCPNAAGTGAINETVALFPVGGLLVYSVTATLSDDPPGSVVNTATVTPGDDATCGPDNTTPPCPATVIGTVVPSGGAVVHPVPTLGTWMLFLLGLGMLGLAYQRRRRFG